MSMTEKLAYIKKLRHLTTEEIAQQSGVPAGDSEQKSFPVKPKIQPSGLWTRSLRSCAFPYTTF